MATPKAKTGKIGRSKTGPTYRGVRLQATRVRTRFTLDQIKKAVETAVAKNADALARRT